MEKLAYLIGAHRTFETLGMTKHSATNSAPRSKIMAEPDQHRGKVPGYVGVIETQTTGNTFFRKVLFTGRHAQLVLMSIESGEDIGEETHENVDQFFRIDQGEGVVILNDTQYSIRDGSAFLVPAGTKHNVVNTSKTEPLRLYSVYSPPNHPPGTIHKTKADAIAAELAGKDQKPGMNALKGLRPVTVKKANGSAKGNFRATSQEELGEYIRNAYNNNPTPEDPPDELAGMGTRPTTNTTSLSKQSLYTHWSNEEPRLRNIGTEDQGAGLQGTNPPRAVEPSSTASPSHQETNPPLPLLGQFRPGVDSAGGGRERRG
jgi:mannose-6-phosphate isomerase-like protein (cupin superfamily)